MSRLWWTWNALWNEKSCQRVWISFSSTLCSYPSNQVLKFGSFFHIYIQKHCDRHDMLMIYKVSCAAKCSQNGDQLYAILKFPRWKKDISGKLFPKIKFNCMSYANLANEKKTFPLELRVGFSVKSWQDYTFH